MRRAQVYNVAVVGAGALLFFAAWVAVERASTPKGLPAWAILVASPLFHIVLGAALFFAFRARRLARVGLAAVVPLASAVLFEVAVGSDPAYPYIALVSGGIAAVTFALGAGAAAGLAWLTTRRQAKQAT